MRLKRLDIFAFKSFMDRTSLSFPAGLSAIVGPNGCGKSNLIDAIRWCIGEQSARSLRGRLMEDIIFAGTGERRPLGLAEVSLTLESGNGSGNGHAVFSGVPEVTITRRLHRSGESEFLLNRRPCRLRDIAQIFLGTGLGGRGYGVIEQGKIEQIIDQRPEERRALVEEAAGVSRYRLERAETVRKLEASQANLMRLGDVLGEIGRQLAGLARQRSLAERHARLRERLRALELAQAARGYLAAQAELALAEETLHGLAAREAEAHATRAELGAQKERLEGLLSQATANRETVGERLQRLRENLASTQTQAQALEGEMALLGREGQRLRASAQEAQRRAEQATAGLARCEQTCQGALSERAGREAEMNALPDRLAQAAEGLERQREVAETAKGELIAALAARSEAANQARSLQARHSETAARLSRKEREAEAARAELGSLEERQAEAAARLSGLAGRLQQARAEEQRLSTEAEAARRRGEELTHTVRSQQGEMAGLRQRHQSLEELAAAARGEAAEGLLEAAREMGAEHFLLSEGLELPEELEAAAGAALGERLRAVVFARTEDALKALSRHRETGRGVALALALDRTQLSGEPGRRLGAEQLGALFGGLQVAATLEEALKAGGAFITRDGAALLPGGWLAASGREPGAAVLAWQREARALAKRISNLERDLALRQAELKAQEAAAAELGLHQEQARRAAHEEAQRLTRLEADSRGLAERVAATGERLRLTGLEVRHATEAAAELEVQLGEAAGGAEAAGRDVNASEERAAAALSQVREAEIHHGAVLERLSTLKAGLAALEEREQAARSEAERLRSQRLQAESEAAALSAEAEATARRAGELAQGREQAGREAVALGERLAALEAEREAAERETQEMRAALAELAGRLSSLEAGFEALRGQVSEARLHRSELALRLESIAARTQELHDLDLAPRAAELAASLDPEADPAAEARRVRESLLRLGEVNPAAPREHEELSARHAELLRQREDVEGSLANLRRTLETIDRACRQQFLATYEALNDKLAQVFATLFGGGTARLELIGEDPLEAGVDIIAQPPGKRLVHMSLLSGGEKAMAATALLFALHLLRPSPFYLLDELDAALDDANVVRLNDLLRELSGRSQLIVVTHNKRTLEMADTLYGVTMQEPGVSKLVSVKLSELAGQA